MTDFNFSLTVYNTHTHTKGHWVVVVASFIILLKVWNVGQNITSINGSVVRDTPTCVLSASGDHASWKVYKLTYLLIKIVEGDLSNNNTQPGGVYDIHREKSMATFSQ